MWDKLLGLFKDKQVTNEIQSAIPEVSQQSNIENFNSQSNKPDGRSVQIGYNYLKGLDGDYEDSSKNMRRFINLNKLLRGKYNGKIEASHAESESDIRREDSE